MGEQAEIRLLLDLFRPHRSAAELTEVLVKLPIREEEKKSLSNRRRLSTLGAIEGSRIQLIELFVLCLPGFHGLGAARSSVALNPEQCTSIEAQLELKSFCLCPVNPGVRLPA